MKSYKKGLKKAVAAFLAFIMFTSPVYGYELRNNTYSENDESGNNSYDYSITYYENEQSYNEEDEHKHEEAGGYYKENEKENEEETNYYYDYQTEEKYEDEKEYYEYYEEDYNYEDEDYKNSEENKALNLNYPNITENTIGTQFRRGIYGLNTNITMGSQGQALRNMWLTRAISDYVQSVYSSFNGIFVINNASLVAPAGGVGAFRWEPEDIFDRNTLESNFSAPARNNNIMLANVLGADLINFLPSNRFTGAFYENGEWFFTNGTEINLNSVYTIATTNFLTNNNTNIFSNVTPLERNLVDAAAIEFTRRSKLPLSDTTSLLTVETTDLGTIEIGRVGTGGAAEAIGNAIVPFASTASNDSVLNINGTRVFLTATPASGYNFAGWYLNGNNLSTEPIFSIYHYSTKTIEAVFEQEANPIIPVRGIYGINIGGTITANPHGQIHRNMWTGRLIRDYLYRTIEDFNGIFIQNHGGASNMNTEANPMMWQPTDPINRAAVYNTFAPAGRANHIVLHTMTGRDLVTLLSIQSGANQQNINFGVANDNWVASGAFRGDFLGQHNINGANRPRWNWYFLDGTPIEDNENTTYIIASNSFIGDAGERFPFPHNIWGSFAGMTLIEQPRPVLYDNNNLLVIDAAYRELINRAENFPSFEDYTSVLTINTSGGQGTVTTFPLSPFEDRLTNVNYTRVTLTAVPEEGYALLGWYINGVRVSDEDVFEFTHTYDKAIEAKFAEFETISVDIFNFADFQGMVDSMMNDDDPGAAAFSAFTTWYMNSRGANAENSILVAGGDNFHGHPLGLEPGVWMFDYLGVAYSSLGNHEFSFGAIGPDTARNRPHPFGNINFLAADLVYAEHTGRYGEHPDFAAPYTIVEFHGGAIRIGMIGLMEHTMATSTNQNNIVDYALRMPTHSGAQEHYIQYIWDIIDRMNNYYGVNTIIGLTHLVPNQMHNLAEIFSTQIEGSNLRNGAFSAIIGGSQHSRTNTTNAATGTHIMESGFHGRTLGRFTLSFDSITGELHNVEGSLSPVNAIRNFSGFTPAGGNPIAPHPEFETVRHIYEYVAKVMARFNEEVSHILDEALSPRGIYGIGTPTGSTTVRGRELRDMWITRVNADAVRRIYSGEFSGIFMSNAGGWRQTIPMYVHDPEDSILMRDLIVTSPFYDFTVLQELTGRDLITILSLPTSGSSADPANPNFGISTAYNAMSGAFRGEFLGAVEINGVARNRWNWYFTDGTPITDSPYVTYIISARSFIIGYDAESGGSRFPFPNNELGRQLGLTAVSTPRVLLADGSTLPITIVPSDPYERISQGLELLYGREKMANELRQRRAQGLENFSSNITFAVEGTGELTFGLEGISNREMYIFSPHEDRMRNINGTRVFVTAIETSNYEFIGWVANGQLVSEEKLFSFVHNENTELIALFEDGDSEIIEKPPLEKEPDEPKEDIEKPPVELPPAPRPPIVRPPFIYPEEDEEEEQIFTQVQREPEQEPLITRGRRVIRRAVEEEARPRFSLRKFVIQAVQRIESLSRN
ncbi:MAG: hypothetical protein FWF50_07145 [Defluviitaleaceae bacterium]|nr:hypothetical protein [Defluviitaleaceae bacterium]